ncbi:MAG: hypothetical protein WCT28_03355 [Patescibacteria group bacterium]|jgi:hypothetical protein
MEKLTKPYSEYHIPYKEPTPETKDRNRKNELIERTLRFGWYSSQLEKYLVQEPENPSLEGFFEAALEARNKERMRAEKKPIDFMQNKIDYAEVFSPEHERRIKSIIDEYKKRKALSERSFKNIAHICFGNIEETERRKKTPEEIGRALFLQTVKESPKGTVALKLRSSYLIIYCEKQEDHEKLLQLSENDETAGMYIHRFHLQFGHLTYIVPIIIVNQSIDSASQSKNAFGYELHERQHYITYKILDKFALDERRPRKQKDEMGNSDQEKLFRLKDELLAFIRDGGSPEDMQKDLLNPEGAYKDINSNFSTPEAAKAARSFIEESLRLLKDIFYFFSGDDGRARIVYMLVGVPLEKFPKWLSEIKKYMDEHWESVSDKEGDAADCFMHYDLTNAE